MNLFALKPNGITFAVEPLVMLIHEHELLVRHVTAAAKLLISALRMRFDNGPFFGIELGRLLQNTDGYEPFADVVQNRRLRERLKLRLFAEAQPLSEDHAIAGDV